MMKKVILALGIGLAAACASAGGFHSSTISVGGTKVIRHGGEDTVFFSADVTFGDDYYYERSYRGHPGWRYGGRPHHYYKKGGPRHYKGRPGRHHGKPYRGGKRHHRW